MSDAFTSEECLCDDGVVRGEYLDVLNRLRAAGGLPPYEGAPFACTGSAHLAGGHIRCTSEAHTRPVATPTVGHRRDGVVLVRVAREMAEFFSGDPAVPADFIADLATVEDVGRWLVGSSWLTLPANAPMKLTVV